MGEGALKAFYQGILIKNRAENDGKFFEMLAFLFCKQGITYHVIIKEREFLFIDVVLYPIFIHTLVLNILLP